MTAPTLLVEFELDDGRYALALASVANVQRVARIPMERVTTVENRSSVQLGNRQLALVHLGEVLGIGSWQDLAPPPGHCLVAELAAAGQAIAFAVDEVPSEQEVLLKDLGSQYIRVRDLAGRRCSAPAARCHC